MYDYFSAPLPLTEPYSKLYLAGMVNILSLWVSFRYPISQKMFHICEIKIDRIYLNQIF